MTNYTIGNWTVSDQVTDTVSATKNLAVADLSYDVDYVVASEEPDAVILNNITAADLMTHESIKYARSNVANVYKNAPHVMLAGPNKTGVQVMAEISMCYRAVNDVTGEEIDIPCKGRVVLRLPNAPYVSPDLVTDLLKRTVAAGLDTGVATNSRLVNMARGALNPQD